MERGMDIIVQRGVVKKLEELPEYSIALDGFVQGPQVDPDHHRHSFDHHSGCLRYCTTAACTQAWTAVSLGLDPENYTVYANDVDSDVCVAVWVLKNPDRCAEPLVKKLVDAVGLGDMHCGAIPLNGMTKIVEWISAPETESRKNDDYSKICDEGLMSILEAVLHRIDLYVDGEASVEVAKSHHKSPEFKILKNENEWVMVQAQDPHVLSAVYHAGFDRVVVVRPQSDGSNAITLAKRSDFVPHFPLPKFYEALNQLELGWGGGTTAGGAPRNADGSRSRLNLDLLAATLNRVINDNSSL
jgi:hypothetical protein